VRDNSFFRGAAIVFFLIADGCQSQSPETVAAAKKTQEAIRSSYVSDRDAGFAWAKKLGVDAPAFCEGHSQAFDEGCDTYVSVTLQHRTTGTVNDLEDSGSATPDDQ
jgi:hypothetical protein